MNRQGNGDGGGTAIVHAGEGQGGFELDRVPPTALEAITRAEIDVQIATANRYPRSITRFLSEAKSIVAIDPDLAALCTYRLPARKGSVEVVSGPSVRLAEIVASCYRNLRISGRITDDDGRFLTAQGVALDLERNVGYSIEVKRGVTTRDGRRFGDDMLKTTAQAAISIATRNVTFKVVPRAFVNVVEDEAMRVASGDVKSLPARTAAALQWFAGKGIPEAKVYAALGIPGPGDMTLDRLALLHGYRTSMKEGLATAAEIFDPAPEPAPQAQAAKGANRAATLAAKIEQAAPAPGPDEPGSGG